MLFCFIVHLLSPLNTAPGLMTQMVKAAREYKSWKASQPAEKKTAT